LWPSIPRSGQWFAAGKGFLKIAWGSGTIELWDVSGGLSKTAQKGTWFPAGNSTSPLTDEKI